MSDLGKLLSSAKSSAPLYPSNSSEKLSAPMYPSNNSVDKFDDLLDVNDLKSGG